MMEPNTIFTGDVIAGLKLIEDKTVNCVVTSPPYWNLRDYGMSGQLGMEKTPEEYVAKIVLIFREVRRVLCDDGTLWLNIGDSYNGSGIKTHQTENSPKQKTSLGALTQNGSHVSGLKPKDLIGIPWMVAFALRADGWYLRSDIIWSKPNCMPEPVTDRPTKSHEYIFLLSKSEKYYYDFEAIKTFSKESSVQRLSQDVLAQNRSARVPGKTNGNMKAVGGGQQNIRKARDKQRGHSRRHNGFNDRWDQMTTDEQMSMGANKRSVWIISPAQFTEAHFATFPEEIPAICIKAGCPIDGLVLDPFIGAGTTAVVARKLNRNYLGIELNPKYVTIAQNRLYKELGMFL